MIDSISRKKAIATVHRMREIWDTGNIDDLEDMIVTALAELCPEKRTETHGVCLDVIDRQAAIDALERKHTEPQYYHMGEDWYVGIDSAETEIYNLPSARPEIIQCKDCVYAADDDYHHCTMVTWWNSDDDFCSKGKRRSNG